MKRKLNIDQISKEIGINKNTLVTWKSRKDKRWEQVIQKLNCELIYKKAGKPRIIIS